MRARQYADEPSSVARVGLQSLCRRRNHKLSRPPCRCCFLKSRLVSSPHVYNKHIRPTHVRPKALSGTNIPKPLLPLLPLPPSLTSYATPPRDPHRILGRRSESGRSKRRRSNTRPGSSHQPTGATRHSSWNQPLLFDHMYNTEPGPTCKHRSGRAPSPLTIGGLLRHQLIRLSSRFCAGSLR